MSERPPLSIQVVIVGIMVGKALAWAVSRAWERRAQRHA